MLNFKKFYFSTVSEKCLIYSWLNAEFLHESGHYFMSSKNVKCLVVFSLMCWKCEVGPSEALTSTYQKDLRIESLP